MIRRRFAFFSEVGLDGLSLDDGTTEDDFAVLGMLISPFVGAGARFKAPPFGELAFRLSWPPSIRLSTKF